MRRNKLQKTVFSVICVVLAVIMMLSLVITVLPAHAVDETDLERLAEKRAQLEEQLAEQEQVIQDLSDNQTLIVYRKAALDKQISLNRETIVLIEEQIAVYQELIDRKEEELAAATAAETEQTSLLRERIRSIAAEHGMTLNDAQTQQLADLFRKIQSLGGSGFAERVQELPETVEKIRETGESALSTAGTIWDSVRGFLRRVGKTLSALFGE